MATFNVLNRNINPSSQLQWSSSFSGQFPLSKFGVNGVSISSTYYSQIGAVADSPNSVLPSGRLVPGWMAFPYIYPGPKNAYATYNNGEGSILRPWTGSNRSVLTFYRNSSLNNWQIGSQVLGNGEFASNINNSTTSTFAGKFLSGNGFVIENGPNSVSIGYTYATTTVTGTTQTMANNSVYIANNASLVTFTLPATITSGARYCVVGLGAGGWRISQNAGQSIRIGESVTTAGTGGYIQSASSTDAIFLVGVSTTQVVALCQPASSGLTIV